MSDYEKTSKDYLEAWRARIAALEAELAEAYLELRKIRPATKAIFDREVWDRAMLAAAPGAGGDV